MSLRLPFVSRRRHTTEVDALRADNARLRGERDRAREGKATAEFNRGQVLRQNAELDAANRRLSGRNLELCTRLSDYAEADPDYLACLERRITCLQKGAARYLAALWQARAKASGTADADVLLRRIKHLEKELDNATYLPASGPQNFSRWQPGYQDPKKATS